MSAFRAAFCVFFAVVFSSSTVGFVSVLPIAPMPQEVVAPMVFVDIETTGATADVDGITEIGIVELSADGSVREWSSLVNPRTPIPPFIQSLTGITNEMVADAPTFVELADEVLARLQGRLFVAHNARFDYGHLKQALARAGLDFSAQVLCTVRLSRKLYPEFTRHNLGALIERHGLQVPARHRALADAQVLWQFWQILQAQWPGATLRQAIDELTGRNQWPAQLDLALMTSLPETHGVYVLYGAGDVALHVGKGHNVRQRVLSHFHADRKLVPAKQHGHLVRRIEARTAAGELGAALLEVRLIHQLQPVHNRLASKMAGPCTWRPEPQLAGMDGPSGQLALYGVADLTGGPDEQAYGLFGTQREAIKTLREIAEGAQLCLRVLGLEPGGHGRPCKALAQSLCSGVCAGRESVADHALRMQRVLADWRVQPWPHGGPVRVRESAHWHVLDAWRYLGTVNDDHDDASLQALLNAPRPDFDRETYKVLAARLPHMAVTVIDAIRA